MLADLGAEVIKVERPPNGDMARFYDKAVQGYSSYDVWLNRGKRSLAVDLGAPAGQEILARLLAKADVMLSNLGPTAADRFLKDIPVPEGLIRCDIVGYSSAGPYRDRKAYDLIIQGEAGITKATGTSSDPAKCGVSVVDLAAGLYALSAIGAALQFRHKTGRGMRIEVPLFEVATEWMSPILLAERLGQPESEPRGMHHAAITPYGAFRTLDGDLVNIAVQNREQWVRLCTEVLDDQALASDEELRENFGRWPRREEVERCVSTVTEATSTSELCAMLTKADVPWGRVNTAMDVLAHGELQASARWISAELPDGGTVPALANPLVLDGESEAAYGGLKHIPALGEDTVAILSELGFDSPALDAALGKGVVMDTGGGKGRHAAG
jgi:crotonobetainyl-CoA:carnitine CoA-transferase CaiB-like acyl-CoA transferase